MGCVDGERLALLDFKKSFPLPLNINIGKLSSWNSSEVARNCCHWEGITCDGDTGHVVSLDLSGQNLESYQLRPSLLQLQYLRSLDLSDNFNIVMRIPKLIGSLTELTYLKLSEAGFFGTIPPQLGNLSKIQTLDLGWNKLSTDNLQWLSHLSSLQSFDMSGLNLIEARDWVLVTRTLPSLAEFECNSCYFPTQDLSSTTVHRVNSSSSLQTVDLTESQLSAFSLSSLLVNTTGNLSELHLSGLELDVPFPDIFHDNLMSLEILDLSSNSLEHGIFNSIGNLCNLSVLDAYGSTINQSLSNIIQGLSGCASSSLEQLWLRNMNVTGIIPSMVNFKSLSVLDLSYNSLDSFPPQHGKLLKPQVSSTLSFFPASLTVLYLDNNILNGVLTDTHFTNFSNLKRLTLSSNPNLIVSFNRTLPRAVYIDLSSCNLGPSFPSWLLSQNRLRSLDISNCKILGTIPIVFWRNLLPSLTYLNLSSNSLSGTIPNMPFPFLYPETIVDMTLNALSGQIPLFLFTANELYLSKNNFSGFSPIPYPYHSSNSPPKLYNGLFENKNLSNVFDLSNNLLSGSIPYWFGFKISNSGALFLTNNNLSGPIPSSIGITRNLYVLSLRNNRFSGSIPSLLKNCSELRILDMAGNRFSGIIPSWIGENLKNLSVLSLESNHLTGILPTSLCHLSSLQILDLSHNLLSGNIPSCIQNFPAMVRQVNSSLRVMYSDKNGITGGMPLEEVFYFNAYITWKSQVWQFQSTLHLVKLIDLSSNNFSGEIPMGLASLLELDSLDLSYNNLQGSIPEQIGQLKDLQILNLSHNRLHGQIPLSLSQISSLEMLDLSHNNLSGRIPKGTQLQSFHPSDFAGNPSLCGLPLCKCPGDNDDSVQALQPSRIDESETDDKWSVKESFYGGLGAGFSVGFLGIIGSLTWIRKWRYAFFQLAAQFGEWILLVLALSTSRVSRKIKFKLIEKRTC